MFDEDDLLPISALQHLAFCERQWGLIHLEGLWLENRLTAEGRLLHERTHDQETESRGDLLIMRGLRLKSLRLGLTGQADVVEFHRKPADGPVNETARWIKLKGHRGEWRPFPVEYKRGRPKPDQTDKVQLCAQALCLEEMLEVVIPQGALYYGQPRRREEVVLDRKLREETETLVLRLHELARAKVTPSARYAKKCDRCSLIERCLPQVLSPRRSAKGYLARSITESEANENEP